MQRDCTYACAVACLHPHYTISNVVVSLMIHDNMYMYMYMCMCVYVCLYVYNVYVCVCVHVCMHVDTHASTRKMVKQA